MAVQDGQTFTEPVPATIALGPGVWREVYDPEEHQRWFYAGRGVYQNLDLTPYGYDIDTW